MEKVQKGMIGTDKMLIGIVVGVILLVGATFAVTLLRPAATYQSEDTPEGVAHNYLFALQEEEYDRAYGYLSPRLEGYPDSVDEFIDDVEGQTWVFDRGSNVSLTVDSADINGDRAVVTVRRSHFYGGGLFDSGQYVDEFEVELHHEDGEWKITGADSFFAWCWDDDDGCH